MLKRYKQAMKCFRQLIISSVSIFLLIALSSHACDIVLKHSVEIKSDNIYLKNIAVKYPIGVKNIFIADSPYINNPLYISRTFVQDILKRNHINLSVCGNSVKIVRKKYIITEKTIISLIRNKNIKILSKMPIVLPYNNYVLKLKNIKDNGNFLYIKLTLFANGKFYRNIGISAKSRHTSLIPVAKFDIRRGETISLSDITFKKLPTYIQRTAFRSLKAIIGKIAICDIRQFQPFTSSNTKTEKLVKRGDLVKVDVSDGSIQISTIAKALRGGFKSDIIPIMYLKSKRIAVATIIGKKEVEIQ